MVRFLKTGIKSGDKQYVEIAGLSTDTKPTYGIVTGSLFLEVDTGDVYAFNEEGDTGHEWGKIAALGGAS